MKKYLIILEGIATSGKTTVLKNLEKNLKYSYVVRSFTEQETLMTILDNHEFAVASKHLDNLLIEFQKTSADIIITDRYHFTHAFRTDKNLDSISKLEESIIKDFKAHIFLLTIQEDKISERVQDARSRRKEWSGKVGTLEEKTKYYIEQQQKLRELAKQSKIPVTEINTTSMNWSEIENEIINDMKLKSIEI